MTQVELARRAALAPTTVERIESRALSPLRLTRSKLLRVLGIPFDRHESIFGPLLPSGAAAARRRACVA